MGFRFRLLRRGRVRLGEKLLAVVRLRRRSLLFLHLRRLTLRRFRLLGRRKVAHPMGQHEFRGPFQILRRNIVPPGKGCFCPRRLDQIDVGAVPRRVRFHRVNGGKADHRVGNLHRRQQRAGVGNFFRQFLCLLFPFRAEGRAVFLVFRHAAHDFRPRLLVRFRIHRYEKPESVEGRGRQCAALRRHDRQHRIAGVPPLRKTVALQLVAARLADREDCRQDIVAQKIRVVDIEDSVLRLVHQSRLELALA